ncbi:MAG: hypothetical protein QOK39_297 [Acidimicrobiaceae bacterium]|jgi:hypothetical protein|nr:hypothetical protein [Acidimicrobiaceae bacterium]
MPVPAGGGQNERVRLALVDELEEFVRRGALWDAPELAALIATLESEAVTGADAVAGLLSQPLRSVALRTRMGAIPPRMANDVEGIVYPRLWKIMEAVRDEMPDGELRTRIQVFNRRLARCFADERPVA